MGRVSVAGAEVLQASSRLVLPAARGLEAAAGIGAPAFTGSGGGAGRLISTGGDTAGGDSAVGAETAGKALGRATVIGDEGRRTAAEEAAAEVGRDVGSATLSAVGSMLRGTWMHRVAAWMHRVAAWMHRVAAWSHGFEQCWAERHHPPKRRLPPPPSPWAVMQAAGAAWPGSSVSASGRSLPRGQPWPQDGCGAATPA